MTMDEVREHYLSWLYSQLREEFAPSETYWGLANLMFDKAFEVHVEFDDNRIAEALELRREFAGQAQGIRKSQVERLGPCSFLEILVQLSRLLEFVAGGGARGWAWLLVTNLELHKMSDPLSPYKQAKVQETLDCVVERRYSPDGQGGFFPLAWPDEDQTRIELWYQLNAYASEIHPEH